jgi:parallel beta helix pectate lyase-like protein
VSSRIGADLTFNVAGVVMMGASALFDEIPGWIAFAMFWGGLATIFVYWVWRAFPTLKKFLKSRFKVIAMDDKKQKKPAAIEMHFCQGGTVKDCDLDGVTHAIAINNSRDMAVTGNDATGNAKKGGVGYRITNSPNTNLKGSVSKDFETGFEVTGSPEANLENTRAEAPKRTSKQVYQVKLPDDYKKSDD